MVGDSLTYIPWFQNLPTPVTWTGSFSSWKAACRRMCDSIGGLYPGDVSSTLLRLGQASPKSGGGYIVSTCCCISLPELSLPWTHRTSKKVEVAVTAELAGSELFGESPSAFTPRTRKEKVSQTANSASGMHSLDKWLYKPGQGVGVQAERKKKSHNHL